MQPCRISVAPYSKSDKVNVPQAKMVKFRQFRDSWRFPALIIVLGIIILFAIGIFGGDNPGSHY